MYTKAEFDVNAAVIEENTADECLLAIDTALRQGHLKVNLELIQDRYFKGVEKIIKKEMQKAGWSITINNTSIDDYSIIS